jgi:hypothetical protein
MDANLAAPGAIKGARPVQHTVGVALQAADCRPTGAVHHEVAAVL